MLVITIITAGVGEFAAGVAAGYELSTGAALVTVGGAEAVTFTTLSQILLEENHSAGHIAWELATNFAMFTAMRRFSAYAEAAKISKFAAAGGQAVLLGAMGLAKEEIAKYATTGKHLTREEIGKIAVQSLVMFVALQGVGHLAQPIMTGIKAEGTMLGLRLNAANRAAKGLKEMQQALLGSKDPVKALEYLDAERTWLDLKIKAYQELRIAAETEAKAAAKSGKPPKDGGVLKRVGMNMDDVSSMLQTLGTTAETLSAARTMLTLEPLTVDTYLVPRSRAGEVLADIGEHKLIKVDADSVHTWEARSPDGRRITITEKLDAADRFYVELRNSVTDPAEAAQLRRMSKGKTAQAIFDMFGGDQAAARAKITQETAKTQSRINIGRDSALRAQELELLVNDAKLLKDPAIRTLIEGMTKGNRAETLNRIRDKIMARVLADEVLEQVRQTEPDAEVLSGVKILERQNESTIQDWKRNHPDDTGDGLTFRPDPSGGPDQLYWDHGEIDLMAIVRTPGGKARIVHREEVKTGTLDKPSRAQQQLGDVSAILASGSGRARLELPDKTDITPDIDLSSDATANKVTRGPSDKKIKTSPADTDAFDESLGIRSGDLAGLVKKLVDLERAAIDAEKAGGSK